MDLRQLRTFLHVSELGSLSRAAERLHVAQPALGRQIRLLEEELGVRLFERHGRGMVPTAAGRTLADRASTILRLVEDTRAEIAAGRDAVRGAVSLGVPPTMGEVIAGRLVERFLRAWPEVRMRVVPAFSGYLLEMLQRGEVDLAVMYDTGMPATEAPRQLGAEPLIEETLFLITPPQGDLVPDGETGFAALAGLPLILPAPRHGLRSLLEIRAHQAGIALSVAIEAEALQTMKDLVARGLGCTVLPLAAVHAELRAGTLRAAPIVRPSLSRRLVLARSLVRPASNAVRLFADMLKAETTEMVEQGIWEGTVLPGRRV